MIQAAEMRTRRSTMGVTRMDRMKNDDIRQELNITYVLDIVERNNMRWYGYVGYTYLYSV